MMRTWKQRDAGLDDDEPTLQSISQLVAAALALLAISFLVVNQSSAAFDAPGPSDGPPVENLPLADAPSGETAPTPVATPAPVPVDDPREAPTPSATAQPESDPAVVRPNEPAAVPAAPTPGPVGSSPVGSTPPSGSAAGSTSASPGAPTPSATSPTSSPSPPPLPAGSTPAPPVVSPAEPSVASAADLRDDDGGQTLFPLNELTPTRPAVECIRVTYAGTDPAALVELFVEAAGPLAGILDLEVEVGDGGGFRNCADFVRERGVYSGPLLGASTGVPVFQAEGTTSSAVVRITVTIDEPPNDLDDEARVDFTWGTG